MSFQAYLDALETKTGKTPRELVQIAHDRGLDSPDTRAGDVAAWLKEDYDVGRGHAMALWHVIKHGVQISDKHVGTDATHRDATDVLWLDGKASNPHG